jgi:hypothetical protein
MTIDKFLQLISFITIFLFILIILKCTDWVYKRWLCYVNRFLFSSLDCEDNQAGESAMPTTTGCALTNVEKLNSHTKNQPDWWWWCEHHHHHFSLSWLQTIFAAIEASAASRPTDGRRQGKRTKNRHREGRDRSVSDIRGRIEGWNRRADRSIYPAGENNKTALLSLSPSVVCYLSFVLVRCFLQNVYCIQAS